jgi:nicotinamide mononucleotide transporter
MANPAFVIDSMVIENNILTANGNNNKPFYIGGTPPNYVYKNNTVIKSAISPGFNFREQLIRPFYYDIKRTTLIEFIAVIAGILSVWFSRKENIYVYPIGLISTIIYIFLSFEQGLLGEASVNFYYTVMSVYGWILWKKRDKRQHRIVRITSSTKQEWIIQLAFFAAFFIVIFTALTYLKNAFYPGVIPWADAFASATAFTGMWLMVKKKVESWYWWIATNIASIPLYFVKHFVFTSMYYCILLVMAIWGLYEWKRKSQRKRVSTSTL